MEIVRTLRCVGALLLLLAALNSPVSSSTIRVPDDYASILYAINAAVGGDTVAVAEGTYYERITLKPDVKLLGGWSGDFAVRDPHIYETVIDAGGSLSVVVAQNGESPATIIDGFTIRGGRGDQSGGIHLYNSSPTVSNNSIINNVAQSAQSSGSAIYSIYGSPVIMGNLIAENLASYYPGGAPIYVYGGNPVITGNLVVENWAHIVGAIWLDHCNGLFEGNTLDGNTGTPCAGIRVDGQSQTILRRNIVVNGIRGVGIEGQSGAVPQTSCNDVWNNELGDYSGVLPGPNSFSLDPKKARRG